MNPDAILTYEATGPADGVLMLDGASIGEMRNMRLGNLRFQTGGEILIGHEVPLLLYWQQYMHHEDPVRNAGSNTMVHVLRNRGDNLLLECIGCNGTRAITSRFLLHVSVQGGRIRHQVESYLTVHGPWNVTNNPHHGEIEFCQLWPIGTFQQDIALKKRYDSCIVQQQGRITRIVHHHLESSDKHNIVLKPGDRFLWTLEDENLMFELQHGAEVHAGLCAYMWDGHFAFRTSDPCIAGTAEAPIVFHAGFAVSSLSRTEAEEIIRRAQFSKSPELETTPVYMTGMNTFSQSFATLEDQTENVWPWTHECSDDSVICSWDRTQGFDDTCSLRIQSCGGSGRWLASTLGPAFGQHPFPDNARYRLSARARTFDQSMNARIGLRFHREGQGSVFDNQTYETCMSSPRQAMDWELLEVLSSQIHPQPDRMHILLEAEGRGTCLFDNVILEILP